MSEFSINGHSYKTARLDAMSQWAVARRLAPVVAKTFTPEAIKKGVQLLPKFAALQERKPEQDGNLIQDPNFTEFLELLASLAQPFMEALAEMPDDDSTFVINMCLSVTHRAQATGGWSVIKPANSKIMFEDIQLPELLQIVFHVVMDNLAGFSFASLSLPAAQTK